MLQAKKNKRCTMPLGCVSAKYAQSLPVCVVADSALPGMLKQVFRIEVASSTHSYPTLNESSTLEIH